MLDIPSREGLAALTAAANSVVPATTLGFARPFDAERVSVLYAYPFGIGEYIVPAADVPDVLQPSGAGFRLADAAAIAANAHRALEWHLQSGEVRHVFSTSVPDTAPAARFWIGLSREEPLTADEMRGLDGLAGNTGRLLTSTLPLDRNPEQLRRMELASGLLPALLRVLDVRDVFDQLSVISQAALPHDMLALGLFNDQLTTLTMYARTGRGSDLGRVFPQPYPPALTRAWHFDILDDRTVYPLERDRPPTLAGMRSSLRLPFTLEGRVVGGLAFHAREPARFSSADVLVARRLADYVAIALSHHQLAERLAESARRSEELRARTASVELLDELLTALVDGGDLADVFGHVSGIARKVLPHDAAALLVRLGDGQHARVYASSGFPSGMPEIVEVPEELLRNPIWEHDILDDLTRLPEPRYVRLVEMGFTSLIRVPIRFDGRFAGGLIFLSNARSAFGHGDVAAARRIADRMAVTLARSREVEAMRRADEAVSRASKLEERVRALTEELDARTGYRRIVGESVGWRQVLTQAAQVAATETTVLLLGESGTGKEVVARFLHRGLGARPGTVHRAQLRRPAGAAARGGAVRLRARCIYRRYAEQARATRTAPPAARSSSTRSPR